MNDRFFLQVILGCVAVFGLTLAMLTEPVQSTVSAAVKSVAPAKLTAEEIAAQQSAALEEAQAAFNDLDDIWKAGDGIKPSSGILAHTPSTWSPPFFMPAPQSWSGKIAEDDTDADRNKLRMRYLKAALAFNQDRCSQDLRKDLMSAFRSYLRGYSRWMRGRHEDRVYYFATRSDQFIVGLQMVLTGEGYLTLGDFGVRRVPVRRSVFADENAARDRAEKLMNARRACDDA